MADINAVHAFREGNGRTQPAFIRQLASDAGHELDFSVVSRERIVQASIAANEHGDSTMMRRMFDESSNEARIAALIPAIEFLEQQGFSWNDRYIATFEPGHAVEVTLAAASPAATWQDNHHVRRYRFKKAFPAMVAGMRRLGYCCVACSSERELI